MLNIRSEIYAFRRFVAVMMALFTVLAMRPSTANGEDRRVDVLVYGGTPTGISAAVTADREGKSVLLVEPYSFVGGMMTNGLSHTDFRTFESITGFYREVTQAAVKHYEQIYGADSQQVKDSWRGTQVEPSVMRKLFERMLQESENVSVVVQHSLASVDVVECCSDGTRHMNSARFVDSDGKALNVKAKVFIDASYEGDLMARADIPFAVGREASSHFNESLAVQKADAHVQGYNFRLIVTDQKNNRIMPVAPESYDRSDYVDVLPLFKSGKLKSVWCASKGGVYKNHRPGLPNNKHDVNDVSRGLARLSLPNDSNGWPNGSGTERRSIFQKHVRHNIGLLYFLQNDSKVPETVRQDACRFGWAKDEFIDHGHVPEQLYVREARRMQGVHVYCQSDTSAAAGDVRSVFHADAIAVGDYSHNCHGTSHEGPLFGGKHVGEFYVKAAPYQIPYGVLIPKKVDNVMVPVACSSSHVGFCALRLEAIWMSLGQASGLAAVMAIDDQVPVQYVEIEPLQTRLHQLGAATIYVADISPDHPDFEAVQWWGQLGGLHGLEAAVGQHGQRGNLIVSQYYEKFPGHDAKLNERLTDETYGRWLQLAKRHRIAVEGLNAAMSRGQFIQAAWAAVQQKK